MVTRYLKFLFPAGRAGAGVSLRLEAAGCWIALCLSFLVPSRAQAQESVYNGAFGGGDGTLSDAIDFETNSGKSLSIINYFKNWDDSNGPLTFSTSAMDGIRNHGSIPMVTWQPEGAMPDTAYALDNITNGNFDSYIQAWALAARAWGHPFFLRFAHEVNGTWYPWSPGVNGNTSADYIAAWRHVHDIFVRYGATNVTWVWCVTREYGGGATIASVYPGDNYVDWISLDCYNRMKNGWQDFSTLAQATCDTMIGVAPGKPILVAEAGCYEDSAHDKGQWFRNAMANYLKYSMPRIKAWCYFNGVNPDGNDWRITTSPGALAGYQFSVGLSYYSANEYASITDSPIQPLPNDATTTDTMAPFVSIITPAMSRVQTGVQTAILAPASDKSGVSKVEFSVNSVLKATDTSAPYQYLWTVPSGAGTTYTLTAKAYDAAGNTAVSTIQVLSKDPPGAPTGVAASSGTFTDKVQVTWNSVSTALGYEVWRNTVNDTASATELSSAIVSGTSFSDTTAAYSPTTYYYWVRAVDDTGPSAFSASDNGYRALPAAPAKPTGVFATDGDYTTEVLVGWSSVSTATSYEIWRSPTNNSATAAEIGTATGTTYDDFTAPYTTVFFYWVKAVNDGGTSPFSNAGSGYRTLPAAPSAPTGVNASDGTFDDEVQVNWQNVGTATSYQIWRNTVNSSASATQIGTATGTPYDDTTTPVYAKVYFYWVKAVNDGGVSGFSTVGSGFRGNLPTISSLGDLSIFRNSNTGPIAFTVGDVETPAASLTVSGSSSNTTLVPAANIVFGGSDADCTVTVTPAANQSGSATITVTVTDADGGQASDSFVLTVVPNTPPTLTAIANQSIGMNGNTGALTFTVGDAETAAASLTLTGSSSNTALAPAANIVFGGSGASRTVTITPASNQTGTVTITVTVSDGSATTSASFQVKVLNQYAWAVTGTTSALNWSASGNWSGGLAAQSTVSTSIIYLAGSTLPAGTITSNNDIASPFTLNSLTLSGTGPAGGAGIVNITGGTLSLAALGDGTAPLVNLAAGAGTGAGAALTYNITAPISISSTPVIQGDGSATFIASGIISGTGGLAKTGNSLFVLSGSNAYTGPTVVKGGTNGVLRVTNASGLGNGGTLQLNTGAVTPLVQLHIDGSGNGGAIAMSNAIGGNSNIVTTIDVAGNGGGNSGNTIQLNGVTTGWGNTVTLNVTGSNGYGLFLAQLKSTGGSAGAQILNPTSAPLTIGAYAGANKNTTVTLDGTNAGNGITGTISDGSAVVSLVKSNTSIWVLSGSSSYSGATTINSGTLQIGNSGTTGAISPAVAISGSSGATLAFNRSDSFTFSNPIAGALALKQNGSGNTILTGSNTYTGATTITSGTLTLGSNTAAGATAGSISISGGANIGQLALANGITVADNITYVGKNSGAGIVNAGGANSLAGTVTLSSGGNTYGVRSDAGYLLFSGSVAMLNSTASKILTVSGSGGVEFAGLLGAASGTLGITQAGTGTLTLSGSNSFNGATTVSSGMLLVNSTLSTTTGITVAVTGTLSGNGTIGAPTVINGTHAPGAGSGAQTFAAQLTYGSTSHLAWDLFADTTTGAGVNFDSVIAAGVTVGNGAVIDLTLDDPASAVDFTDTFWQSSHAWTALSATSITGAFALGAAIHDSNGVLSTDYGLFSLEQTGTALNILWTPFTPTQAWQYHYFGANWNNAAITGDAADPDGDGLSNLVEYALGKSPAAMNASGITSAVSGGNLTLTYTFLKSATDITVQPVWSTDMLSWSNVGVTRQVLSDDGVIQTIQALVSTGTNSKMFIRLQVTRP